MTAPSYEYELAEWVEMIEVLGAVEDYDGSDRPGLAAAIAENLPSNEVPVGRRWDLSAEIVAALALASGKPPVYWMLGPASYHRSAARTN